VSAAQWIGEHLRWSRPAGWRAYPCRFSALPLLPDGATITAIRTPPDVTGSNPRSLSRPR